MNTLDDLRATLGHEADAVDDADRYARPIAVRERIRVVRRRRTTVTAVAAAVLVVTGVAVLGTLDRPDHVQPASHPVAGQRVPDRVSMSGFPYAWEQGRTFAAGEPKVLHLDRTDHERAASLAATGLGSGSATLLADGDAVARVRAGSEISAPVSVSDVGTRLRVRLDGAPASAQVGLAVFESTGDLAEGVSNGDAVFRRTIGDRRLDTGAFSDPGDADLSVSFTGALDDLTFSEYCSASERGLWINVAVDGHLRSQGPCRTSDDRDPGASFSSFEGSAVRERTLRVFLTRGHSDAEVSSPSAVLGVGVYRVTGEEQRILGLRVAPRVEADGRTWALERVIHQPDASRGTLDATIDTTDGDRLLGLVTNGRRVGLTWDGRLAGGESAFVSGTGGASSSVGGVLFAGDRYRVTLDDAGRSPFDAALLVYRPV